jgi:NAD(P)-dependent dehydrogenase (short-subunit alcohol dehydrogenase family)
MSNLKGKVALVTGSARGIGKAIAERYGSLGASVVVNYVASEGPAQETVAAIKRLGGAATAIQADVSKVTDIDRLFAKAIEQYGRVDIVVANAGLELVGKPMTDITEGEFDRLFELPVLRVRPTRRSVRRKRRPKAAFTATKRTAYILPLTQGTFTLRRSAGAKSPPTEAIALRALRAYARHREPRRSTTRRSGAPSLKRPREGTQAQAGCNAQLRDK